MQGTVSRSVGLIPLSLQQSLRPSSQFRRGTFLSGSEACIARRCIDIRTLYSNSRASSFSAGPSRYLCFAALKRAGTEHPTTPASSTLLPSPSLSLRPSYEKISIHQSCLTDAQPSDMSVPATWATTVTVVTAFSLALPPSAMAFEFSDAIGALEATIAAAGPLGPALFVLAYAVSAVFLVPGSLLTVAAGFLFGPVTGTLAVSAGATLGATSAFLVGRYLARPWVASKLAEDSRFVAVDAAIADQGAKIVLLLRLSPLFPYTLLNYALSLTAIPLGSYVAASWAGMLPGTVAYVALGGAGKAAAETAAGSGGTSAVQLAVYALGVVGTLGASVLISRAAGKALEELEDK